MPAEDEKSRIYLKMFKWFMMQGFRAFSSCNFKTSSVISRTFKLFHQYSSSTASMSGTFFFAAVPILQSRALFLMYLCFLLYFEIV
ncbi:hypothetical protein AAC387_Pa10g0411 [Persea americana]